MNDCKPLPAPVRPRIPLPREDVERPWSVKLDTLAGFQNLPRELHDRIFRLACTLLPLQKWPGTDCSPSAIDLYTASNIALVSRSSYRATIELLYERILLKRPSALAALQRTLASRPNLGRLVKYLHVGPTEDMPPHSWPTRSWAYGVVLLSTALMGSDGLPPSWYSPCQGFAVPYAEDGQNVQYRAVSDAIIAASRDLDVDTKRLRMSHDGSYIGANAYAVRLHEVQAAAELYLLQMRRCENSTLRTESETLDYRYPRLAIAGSATAPEENAPNIFWLTRSQLRAHTARQGAKTDDFGHPLIFARSGLKWTTTGSEGTIHDGGGCIGSGGGAVEDGADVFSLGGHYPGSGYRRTHIDVYDDLLFPAPSTSTVGGNLALLRALLAFTPRIKSLSLTGFPDRALVGERSPPALNALQSLTIGPPPPRWSPPLHLQHPCLHRLKRLRLCGVRMRQAELDCIIGKEGALPQLEEFQWSLSSKFTAPLSSYTPTLLETINFLLDFNEEAAAEDSGSSPSKKKRPRESAPNVNHRARPLSIQACLHGEDVQEVLAAAPSPELRSAWRNGTLVAGYNRFQVFINRGYEESSFERWKEIKAMREMYEEGREWWDAGVKRYKREGEWNEVGDEGDEQDDASEE